MKNPITRYGVCALTSKVEDMEKIEPALREILLAHAKALAKHREVKLATISRKVHGDAPFFDRLAGPVADRGSFTVRKFDEVMAKFDEIWPADLDRPVGALPAVAGVGASASYRRFGRRRVPA